MTVSFHDLNSLGFVASHQITLDQSGLPRFSAIKGPKTSDAPSVYLWVAHATGSEAGEVLYVGKAGKGVARRSAQHQGGFVNSGAGRKNAAALAEVLETSGMTISVLAREAETMPLFGQTVSLYATEEDALCARFRPRLNRAAFPEVSVSDAGQEQQPTASAQNTHGNLGMIAGIINARLRDQDEGTLDDFAGQLEAYGPREMDLLWKLLEFADTQILAPEHELKLVGNYANQVEGCNGVTTLGFGKLAVKSFSPNGWVARIYLTNPPRLALPLKFLNPLARDLVMTAQNSFAPVDVDAFLKAPTDYILEEFLR